MVKTNSILNSKKGYFYESIQILIVLFVFGIIAIASYNIFGELNTDIQASDDLSSDAKLMSSNLYARFPETIDGAFLFIFILLWIVLLVAIWFYDSNPLFIIIVFIVMVFLIIAAGMMSNFWEDMATSDDFDYASDFPSTYFILNNLLLVMSVLTMSVIGTMYMKSRT